MEKKKLRVFLLIYHFFVDLPTPTLDQERVSHFFHKLLTVYTTVMHWGCKHLNTQKLFLPPQISHCTYFTNIVFSAVLGYMNKRSSTFFYYNSGHVSYGPSGVRVAVMIPRIPLPAPTSPLSQFPP